MKKGFFTKVYDIVKKIPKGKVATYGQISHILGSPYLSNQVGWALHANPNPSKIPCHRVVNKSGQLAKGFAFGGEEAQRALLEKEGVVFREDGTINLLEFGCSEKDLK